MVSYTITASTEHEELQKLLRHLKKFITDSDEIIIQLDSSSVTDEVRQVAINSGSKVIEFPLNKDFATFKNNLHQYCTKQWIFNIDADELPAPQLIYMLHRLLEQNEEVDAFMIPRWNTVLGITDEHIQRWGWKYDEFGRINFPDYQWRIYKNNGMIKWINPVHEQLDGFKSYASMPIDTNNFCLFHNKTIERQEKQNQFYSTITR